MAILLRIYAKCIFRQRDGAMRHILDATQDEPPEPGGGGTAIVTSPHTPSTCRLVAMMRRPGQARSSASAITAHASARRSH